MKRLYRFLNGFRFLFDQAQTVKYNRRIIRCQRVQHVVETQCDFVISLNFQTFRIFKLFVFYELFRVITCD